MHMRLHSHWNLWPLMGGSLVTSLRAALSGSTVGPNRLSTRACSCQIHCPSLLVYWDDRSRRTRRWSHLTDRQRRNWDGIFVVRVVLCRQDRPCHQDRPVTIEVESREISWNLVPWHWGRISIRVCVLTMRCQSPASWRLRCQSLTMR